MDHMFQMDFKVRKYIQHARDQEFDKHHNEGDLDTLDKIDQKFNDFCTTYEKQFDQILSRETTKTHANGKRGLGSSKSSKSFIGNNQVFQKKKSLNGVKSGSNLNGSVDFALDEEYNKKGNQQISSLQSDRVKSNKFGSMPSMYTQNFIIRKNQTDSAKGLQQQKSGLQSSLKSFSQFDTLDTQQQQQSPLKVNRKINEIIPASASMNPGSIYNILQRPNTTQNSSANKQPFMPANQFDSPQINKISNYPVSKQNDDTRQLQRSTSRKNTAAIVTPQKSHAKINTVSTTPSLNKISDFNNNKTVKFLNESPKITSLTNIEEIQNNLVKIGVGAMLLEQLRLSQVDLNKCEDINSFKDKQSLLSSKILKEFGIGQAQVLGFKNENDKQDFIKKSIDNTVNTLYKKWIKSYEERNEKIEKMEEEYSDFKEKINFREKQDFEWINIETQYKALENELKQLIVKKLNDYDTQTYILNNMMTDRKSSSSMSQPLLRNSIDSKEYGYAGSLSNGLESPPLSPLQSSKQIGGQKKQQQQDGYSIRVTEEIRNLNSEQRGSLQNFTPRKQSVDSQRNVNSYAKQIYYQPTSSRGGLNERQSHMASTVLQTDHSNATEENSQIKQQSNRKGMTSLQLDTQTNFTNRKSVNQSAANLSAYPYNAEESILFGNEKQHRRSSSIQKLPYQQFQEDQLESIKEQNTNDEEMRNGFNLTKVVTNRDGKKYVYGENTYVKEEILDENLTKKITEYVDKSDYIKELGQHLTKQMDWKIELDNAFIELRKENRKKNNKISKGNNMNLITFFPIMQDVFKNLKSDINKEKLMQKYNEGEILTKEQLSFLASTNSLLNKFIDRDYLDRGIKFFQKKGIQSNLEYLLAENVTQTYDLIKQVIYQHRRNYLFHKNKQLLYEQDMFKQKQEQKVIDLEKAKEKIRMNKRMDAVCRSLDKKLIQKEQERMDQQNRAFSQFNKDQPNNRVNSVAQKFVTNIKKSIMEKQSLRDIFINNISMPKQHVKIQDIKQKKKDSEEKEKNQKFTYKVGSDLISRLTNKAKYEDDPKNNVRQVYHPSSKLFVEDKREDKQVTFENFKMEAIEINRFKRKFNQSKAQDQEVEEKNNFAHFYTGGPLQSSYINSKYYGEKQIHVIIKLQAIARGYLARKILKKLKLQKKREMELKRKADKTREKELFKERMRLELFSPRSILDKMTPKSKKSADGSPKTGFSDAMQSKKIKKKSRFSKTFVRRKSIMTQTQFDLAMQNEMKLNYHRKMILNQDVSNRFQKLIGAAKSNNFTYIEKGKFQFFTMDVNRVDELKNSPLYYAAAHGNILFCQYLIELGADLNQVCQYGNTPFHMACYSNNKNLIMLFQQAGGNLDKINNEGLTPLSYASFEMLEQLDAMKVISLRDLQSKPQFKNIKIFKRGMAQSEFQTSAIEYDPSHQFAQFPSQQKPLEQ